MIYRTNESLKDPRPGITECFESSLTHAPSSLFLGNYFPLPPFIELQGELFPFPGLPLDGYINSISQRVLGNKKREGRGFSPGGEVRPSNRSFGGGGASSLLRRSIPFNQNLGQFPPISLLFLCDGDVAEEGKIKLPGRSFFRQKLCNRSIVPEKRFS